jgi:adenylate cyclase
MFNEVFDYYSSTLDDRELIDILKRNLYLKVDPQISKYVGIKDKKNIPTRSRSCRDTSKTGVGHQPDPRPRQLRGVGLQQGDGLLGRREALHAAELPENRHTASLASTREKDLGNGFQLLSRKIKTHFAREHDKIDNFITFKDTPSESILYIEPVSQGIHETEWRLFKRNKSEKDTFISTTLRVEKNLLRLLMWMAVNGVYDPFSRGSTSSPDIRG